MQLDHCSHKLHIYMFYSVSTLLLQLLLSSSSTYAKSTTPSSCGNISNISCPFSLKGDGQKCGKKSAFSYELVCNQNRTIIYLPNDGYYYYVLDIDYTNYKIRVADTGLQKNNCSSRPLHSIQEKISFDYYLSYSENKTLLTFIDCPYPVISPRYINITTSTITTTACNGNSTSNTNSLELYSRENYSYYNSYRYYYYVVVDYMRLSEVKDGCIVSKTSWVSSYNVTSNTSNYSDIHDAMVYGFHVSWADIYCRTCESENCQANPVENYYSCYHYTCSLRHKNSYKASIYCLRKNLIDILETIKRLRYVIAKIVGTTLAARFLCGIAFLLALMVYKLRGRRHFSMFDNIEDFLQGQNNLMPIRYGYSDIKKITNNFRHKLGEGGFGTVYKGKLRSGTVVAVKIMGESKATTQDFINEVATIGRIHHVNVVQLKGFCFKGRKRALIYEYMPNGSLEKYIFPREGEEVENEITTTLSYKKMFEISYEVASGIEYLHRGCDVQILHFDIKPHNILLDKNYRPKISDFGLAKLYAPDDSIVNLTAARGTMGYMAPELFYKNIGGVSYKADIYSFGMLLMEMANRRRNLNSLADQPSQLTFPLWVYDQYNDGNEIQMEDANATEEEKKLVKKMIIVSLWCIQMKPSDRPPMSRVKEMLEGDVEVLILPPRPFLCPQESQNEVDQEVMNPLPPVLIVSCDDDSITLLSN